MAKRKPAKAETVASGLGEHVPEIHVIKPGEIRFAGQTSLDSAAKRYQQKLIEIKDDSKRPGRPSSKKIVREEAQRRLDSGKSPGL